MQVLKKQSRKPRKVSLTEIGTMLKLVSLEYPTISRDFPALAEKVSMIFKVDCRASDIEEYDNLYMIHEDYERETRKIEYDTLSR